MEKYIETTMENLERNNIKPFYVEKREEVVPLIKTLLKKGDKEILKLFSFNKSNHVDIQNFSCDLSVKINESLNFSFELVF